jgi:zinc transport system substrate-binding protein
MNRYGKYRPLALLLTALAAGCGQESPDESAGEPAVSGELNVVTVNYPLAYFAERILGDAGRVSFPAPTDVDPAYWSPDVAAISEYQQADLIILNGAGYAGWVANATLPRSRLVDTTAAVSDRLIPIEDTVTHTHGPGGDHSHGGTAFTTWLDLEIAQAQARAVLDALARARPELKEEFSQAFEKLKSDLAELDASLDEIGRKLRETPLLFSHPVYQYLERGYGLNAYTVHWEPDEVPEDAQWRHLQSVLQQHPAKIMVWEDEPLDETRRRLSELGVESIVFSPGGNRHVEGDWLTLMQEGISAMTALRASSDPHRN